MGELKVRGSASKTGEYDIMKIELDFHAREQTAKEASEKVLRECEEFLEVLKNGGVDISSIYMSEDSVKRNVNYLDEAEKEYYKANRILEIECKFNMEMINKIRSIINNSNAQVGFSIEYELSNEDAIRQDLLLEALKNAKRQAEVMAQAVDQRVVGLISADENAQKKDTVYDDDDSNWQLRCICEQEVASYDNSDELSSSKKTCTETIYTTWEIA